MRGRGADPVALPAPSMQGFSSYHIVIITNWVAPPAGLPHPSSSLSIPTLPRPVLLDITPEISEPLPRETKCNFTTASYLSSQSVIRWASSCWSFDHNDADSFTLQLGTKGRGRDDHIGSILILYRVWGGDLCTSVKCWTTPAHQAAVLLPGSLSCFSLSSLSDTWCLGVYQPPSNTYGNKQTISLTALLGSAGFLLITSF